MLSPTTLLSANLNIQRVRLNSLFSNQVFNSSPFLERASTRIFSSPGRYVIRKWYSENRLAQAAYRAFRSFLVLKYSNALQSVTTRNSSLSPTSSSLYIIKARTMASISLSQIGQLYSAPYIFLEKYAVGSQSSRYYQRSTPTSTLLKVLVSTRVGLLYSKYRNTSV